MSHAPSRAGAPSFDFDSVPRRVAFDIEIADVFELEPGEDLDARGPFSISCAAAACDRGSLRHWYRKDPDGKPARALDAALARDVLLHLRELQRRGVTVCAWNGLSFDLKWLGIAADDRALAREVALDLVDPMFQLFVQRGFPVSLASAAEGLGIAERKLMDGADAPKEWARGNHQLVLDYVAGDCRLTEQVVARIAALGELRWRTRQGKLSTEPMRPLRPVRELLAAPEPDTSWMSQPIPRAKFCGWLSE